MRLIFFFKILVFEISSFELVAVNSPDLSRMLVIGSQSVNNCPKTSDLTSTKIEKKFCVVEISAFELVAVNSPDLR